MIERDDKGFEAPVPVGSPARAGLPDGQSTGPEIGERLPDFELPDANGVPLNFHRDRGGRKAVLVFYRSAIW